MTWSVETYHLLHFDSGAKFRDAIVNNLKTSNLLNRLYKPAQIGLVLTQVSESILIVLAVC